MLYCVRTVTTIHNKLFASTCFVSFLFDGGMNIHARTGGYCGGREMYALPEPLPISCRPTWTCFSNATRAFFSEDIAFSYSLLEDDDAVREVRFTLSCAAFHFVKRLLIFWLWDWIRSSSCLIAFFFPCARTDI